MKYEIVFLGFADFFAWMFSGSIPHAFNTDKIDLSKILEPIHFERLFQIVLLEFSGISVGVQ